jgi:hypothetical protein
MRLQTVFFVVFLTAVSGADVDNETLFTFPADFLLGAATASYQIEGGWNADGKAEFKPLVSSGYRMYLQVQH